jgi:hypothetical protein
VVRRQCVSQGRYPSIFNIVRDRHSSLAKILATHPLNVSF